MCHIDPAGSDYKEYHRCSKDVINTTIGLDNIQTGCKCCPSLHSDQAQCRQLRRPLSFSEWNQEAVEFIGVPYEANDSVILSGVARQDADAWNACCAVRAVRWMR